MNTHAEDGLGDVVGARAPQGVEGAEIQLAVAPLQHPHIVEVVVFQAVDGFLQFGLQVQCCLLQIVVQVGG